MAFLGMLSEIIGNGWYYVAHFGGGRVVLRGVLGGIAWHFGWYCVAYPILRGGATH